MVPARGQRVRHGAGYEGHADQDGLGDFRGVDERDGDQDGVCAAGCEMDQRDDDVEGADGFIRYKGWRVSEGD